MGGVGAIVFTAGVGENSTDMREHICQGLEYMGVKMDAEKNKVRGKEADVSTPDSKVKIFIIPTKPMEDRVSKDAEWVGQDVDGREDPEQQEHGQDPEPGFVFHCLPRC